MKINLNEKIDDKVSIYNIVKGYFEDRSSFIPTFTISQMGFNMDLEELFDSSFSNIKPNKIQAKLLEAEQQLINEGFINLQPDSNTIVYSGKRGQKSFKARNKEEQEIVSLAVFTICDPVVFDAQPVAQSHNRSQETMIHDFMVECGLEAE